MKLDIDTIGIEFTFDVKIDNKGEKSRFYRELYGWKSPSYYNKYVYIKDGVLSNLKYLKPTKSTIIVSMKDAGTLRKFFSARKVVFNEKIVVLNKKEARKLGLSFPSNWHKIYEELKGSENLRFSVDF